MNGLTRSVTDDEMREALAADITKAAAVAWLSANNAPSLAGHEVGNRVGEMYREILKCIEAGAAD